MVRGQTPDVQPTRAVEPGDDAAYDGVGRVRKDDWDRPRLPLGGNGRRGRGCQDDVGLQVDQLLRERSYPIDVIDAPPFDGASSSRSSAARRSLGLLRRVRSRATGYGASACSILSISVATLRSRKRLRN
jgi:hypothetical protein